MRREFSYYRRVRERWKRACTYSWTPAAHNVNYSTIRFYIRIKPTITCGQWSLSVHEYVCIPLHSDFLARLRRIVEISNYVIVFFNSVLQQRSSCKSANVFAVNATGETTRPSTMPCKFNWWVKPVRYIHTIGLNHPWNDFRMILQTVQLTRTFPASPSEKLFVQLFYSLRVWKIVVISSRSYRSLSFDGYL